MQREQLSTSTNIVVQLGLVLNGNVIEDLSVGGPAFNSCLLKTGDIICKVNGLVAIENLLPPHLDGMQTAGSHVVLTILRTAVFLRISHLCKLVGSF